MKKAMNIVGFIAALLSILGMIFKIMHWPGAGPLLILGFSSFSFFFIPVYGYNLFYEQSGKKSKVAGVVGTIGLIFIALSVIFKIQHWPGAGPALIIGWGFLCLIIFPLLMVIKVRSSNTWKEKFLNITWYLSLSLILLGYTFKIMHLPFAGLLLFSGMLLIALGYLPLAYKMYNNDENRKKLYARFVLIPAFLIQISLVSMGVSKDILNSFVIVDTGINETSGYLEDKNNSFYTKFEKLNSEKAKLFGQKAKKIKELSSDLYEHVEKLKIHLMRESDRISIEIPDDSISLRNIDAKDNRDIPSHILIGDPDAPKNGAWSATELKAKIFVYRQDIICMYDGEMKEIAEKTLGLKTTDTFDEEIQENISWEMYYYYHLPLATVIPLLSKLQSDVRYAESVTVDYLYNQAEKEFDKNVMILSDTVYFENPEDKKNFHNNN